jgi:SOS response regulatory protein OraA/RecX
LPRLPEHGTRHPILTAVRRTGRGRVALEVDGQAWRKVPEEVVLRAGLASGDELDRPALRRLRAELRRLEALATATRALARQDLSRARLSDRLRTSGVAPAEETQTLALLESNGLLNDRRLAVTRAAALAERGWGDDAIVARLESQSLEPEDVRAALASLPPECERAATLAAGTDNRRSTGQLLARRGFSPDSIEFVVGVLDEDA